MLINIYFVEAPFQLVSATASQSHEVGTDAWLFVRESSSKRNDSQLIRLLQKEVFSSPWKRIIYLDGSSSLRLLFAIFKLLVLLSPLGSKINRLSIGDFRSRFALIIVGIIKFRELCILDDGVATLGLYTSNKGKLCAIPIDDNSGQAIKSLAKLKNRIKSRGLTVKLLVSTFLSLPKSKDWLVEQTNLNAIFYQFRVHSKVIDESLVYIVGSKVVEEGIVKAEVYNAFCKKICQRYPRAKLVYIAHREESPTKLSSYNRDLGFEILRPDLPLEFLLCQTGTYPSSIVSLYSAALFTCRLIEPKLNLVSYVLAPSQVLEKYTNTITTCYSYLEADQKTTLIPLDE